MNLYKSTKGAKGAKVLGNRARARGLTWLSGCQIPSPLAGPWGGGDRWRAADLYCRIRAEGDSDPFRALLAASDLIVQLGNAISPSEEADE